MRKLTRLTNHQPNLLKDKENTKVNNIRFENWDITVDNKDIQFSSMESTEYIGGIPGQTPISRSSWATQNEPMVFFWTFCFIFVLFYFVVFYLSFAYLLFHFCVLVWFFFFQVFWFFVSFFERKQAYSWADREARRILEKIKIDHVESIFKKIKVMCTSKQENF